MNPQGISISVDNLPIWVALVCAIGACVAYMIAWSTRSKQSPTPISSLARKLYYVSFGAITAAAVYLMQCILSGNRFDIAYVYQNSAVSDGLIYRISSFWAGQQGSLLLWALLIGLVGVPIAKRAGGASPLIMGFWCSLVSYFLALLVIDDPMRGLVGAQQLTDGLGMNPLLKNSWMVIHPPVVFLGYALLCVPAAFAIQGTIERDSIQWSKHCRPWALAGWTVMTAGLVVGMIWSYDVLGWGGYWGWDPVENASLVPWLLATALIHGLALQQQKHKIARLNVILAFATFISVLYAAYLTRSGVLSDASVHSFGDASNYRDLPIYAWLKWGPIGYAALCFGLLVTRWRALLHKMKAIESDSRDFALAIGLIAICLFALVVLLGTTYTTFNTAVELKPSFYTHLAIPLTIAMLVLTSLSPLLKWGGDKGQWKENLALWSAIPILAIVVAIAVIVGVISLVSPSWTHATLGWLIPDVGVQSRMAPFALVLMLGVALMTLLSSWIPLTRSSLWRCGAHIAHAGVALMVIGMILSSAGRTKVLDLRAGGPSLEAFGSTYSYEGIKPANNGRQEIRLLADRNGKSVRIPLAITRTPNGNILFPYVRSLFLSDIYIAPEKMIADTVNPTLRLGEKGWVPKSVSIPGDKATLAIVGMTVESEEVSLEYIRPGSKPIEFVVSANKPVQVDGYTFSFEGFSGDKAHNAMPNQVGAVIGISGRECGETAVVRVSTKPFINLLWIGTLLIFTGGNLAWDRRREENAG